MGKQFIIQHVEGKYLLELICARTFNVWLFKVQNKAPNSACLASLMFSAKVQTLSSDVAAMTCK